MARKVVKDAVMARLAAGFTAIPVHAPNSLYEAPADGLPFVYVDYPVGAEETLTSGSPGSNLIRDTGTIRFTVNSSRGYGLDDADGWILTISDLFRNKSFAGVQTWEVSPPATDDSNEEGMFFSTFVSVEYFYDFYG